MVEKGFFYFWVTLAFMHIFLFFVNVFPFSFVSLIWIGLLVIDGVYIRDSYRRMKPRTRRRPAPNTNSYDI